MKQLEINQKVEIEVLTGTYQGNYLSKVADFVEAGVIITGLYREGSPLPIRLNQLVNVYYTTDRAAYKFESKILKRTNKPIPLLLIEESDSVTRIQRRDYFRLDVTGTVDVYKMIEDKNYPKKLAEARLQDISGGGIGIQLKKKFEKGEEILINLKNILKPKEFIKSKIVRIDRENNELYNYGVEFLKIEEEQREEIIQWIFAYQRKSRKKGLR
ncbi:c-di-GMP-binding flagellar brake protein YcgR [Halanaerobium saccharolyticum]|uniref:C-di-GMP-binding flagellar brake protein YcgR n=1 Tax=Halanaerobium saccharolyticum TaxID=43595 RepID=A0A4V3G445_9FIRM|nr:flagellar brake protein [Halanaerobium saccharolyticum]RAK08917.1 c-di-GMP-binding flagellar brake protein YcgR [Halanaerobium saccharolyticum]TDV98957.1 c-di-GMP-binding flagellar brake protein YcgR [Halanaerobium saccharolyticum]TDX60680.1 c-di-GMP-binding flagellar brake protein YcgR [Halanaerobium saccharolyticum]